MATKKKNSAKAEHGRRWPWLLLALLAIVGLFLWLGGDDEAAEDEEEVVDVRFREGDIERSERGGAGEDERGPGVEGGEGRDRQEDEAHGTDPVAEGVTFDTEGLYREEIEDYRRAARLPQSNEQIEDGQVGDQNRDPVLRDRLPTKVSAPDQHGDGRILTTWPLVVGFEHPQPIVLHAAFMSQGNPLPMPATITGRVLNESGDRVTDLVYLDDGGGADAQHGDGIFTVAFEMPEDHVPAQAQAYRVLVEGVVEGRRYGNTAGFLYSNPWSALTGNYRDQLRDGSIVFGAEVEVRQAGRFHMQATIAGGGQLIGWGQTAGVLEPGTHWLEITFYGVMFHDAGIAGPYAITSLSLATVEGMPAGFNELQQNVHTTQPYALDQLTSEPFGDPHFTMAAERAERELEEVQERRAIDPEG